MKFRTYLEEAMIVPDLSVINRTFDSIRAKLSSYTLFGKVRSSSNLLKILNSAFNKYKVYFELGSDIDSYETEDGEILEGVSAALVLQSTSAFIRVSLGPVLLENLGDSEYQDSNIKALTSMIGHELVHAEQIARRLKAIKDHPSSEDARIYYANTMEIQAYAYQIAKELKDLGHDKASAEKLLRSSPEKINDINDRYGLYFELFGKNSKVVNRLNKSIYLYLQKYETL